VANLYGRGGFSLEGLALSQDETEAILYNAARVLSKRGYRSAAGLLKRFPFEIFRATNDFGDDFNVLHASVPLEGYEELTDLTSEEEGSHAFYMIAEVISEIGPFIRYVACDLEREEAHPGWRGKDLLEIPKSGEQLDDAFWVELIQELQAQRDLMIDVATGGRRIQDVNKEYESRRSLLVAMLQNFGTPDPSPFTNLWQWYERWRTGEDLKTYQDRRLFVSQLYDPVIERLRHFGASSPEDKLTGWHRVDRVVFRMKTHLATADTEEACQTVGLLCREILISLAQAVYDPSKHQARDGVQTSKTDAYRMLGAYIFQELPGDVNEAARRYTKASLTLANDLQHKRTASYRDAALCAEATTSLVNSIAIIAGRHSPQKKS
jgi:hypothetical protein